MTKIQLTALLQRFMDGTTTVDEETALADFFRNAADSDRPGDMTEDDWRTYREMFAMFEAEAAADMPAADTVPTVGRAVERRRMKPRRLAGWLAAAAAVALLVVAGLAGRQDDDGTAPAELLQTVAAMHAENAADSIASEPEQSVAKDSVEQRVRKSAAKARRPYWQPRPPKVYMAEKTEAKGSAPEAGADARNIEEAVSQAEILLQAISAHQSAELERLQSQAMEVFGDDGDTDGYEGDADGYGGEE